MTELAWAVSMYGDGSEIIFAGTAEEAWAEMLEISGGPCEEVGCGFATCECYPNGSVDRVKRFDSYAPGPVPLKAFKDAGWLWHCADCFENGYTDPCDVASDWDIATDEAGKEIALCQECLTCRDEAMA